MFLKNIYVVEIRSPGENKFTCTKYLNAEISLAEQ